MSRELSGFRAWMWQRLSAIYLALYILYVLLQMLIAPPGDHLAWRTWIGFAPMLLATGLFFLALLLHAWIGVRDVLLDYAKPALLRLVLLALVLIFLIACGLWLLVILQGVR